MDIREIFCNEGGKTLKQAVQRGGGCSIHGNSQGQIGQDSKQPGLVEDFPALCRVNGLVGLQRSLQTQTILSNQIKGRFFADISQHFPASLYLYIHQQSLPDFFLFFFVLLLHFVFLIF